MVYNTFTFTHLKNRLFWKGLGSERFYYAVSNFLSFLYTDHCYHRGPIEKTKISIIKATKKLKANYTNIKNKKWNWLKTESVEI